MGLTLLALALPLVTSSANTVGVDKPHRESKEKRECAFSVQSETQYVYFGSGNNQMICAVTVTTTTLSNCNQITETNLDCA